MVILFTNKYKRNVSWKGQFLDDYNLHQFTNVRIMNYSLHPYRLASQNHPSNLTSDLQSDNFIINLHLRWVQVTFISSSISINNLAVAKQNFCCIWHTAFLSTYNKILVHKGRERVQGQWQAADSYLPRLLHNRYNGSCKWSILIIIWTTV